MDNMIRLSTQEDAWETIGVTYEQANLNIYIGHVTYLDYDGSISTEPVNQIPTYRPTSATPLSPPMTSR